MKNPGTSVLRRRSIAMMLLVISSALVLAGACSQRRTTMGEQQGKLHAELTVLEPRVDKADDLRVRVVLSNKGPEPIRFNGLDLGIPKVLLKVRKEDATPVHPGPPGMPPIDDGEAGRFVLKPGESKSFEYSGSQYFGTVPAKGRYQVRFSYINTVPQHGDWTGTLESEWVPFEVLH